LRIPDVMTHTASPEQQKTEEEGEKSQAGERDPPYRCHSTSSYPW